MAGHPYRKDIQEFLKKNIPPVDLLISFLHSVFYFLNIPW